VPGKLIENEIEMAESLQKSGETEESRRIQIRIEMTDSDPAMAVDLMKLRYERIAKPPLHESDSAVSNLGQLSALRKCSLGTLRSPIFGQPLKTVKPDKLAGRIPVYFGKVMNAVSIKHTKLQQQDFFFRANGGKQILPQRFPRIHFSCAGKLRAEILVHDGPGAESVVDAVGDLCGD